MGGHPRRAALGTLGGLGLSLGILGCGEAAPAPQTDRFNPARPTRQGSIGDAVRGAADRAGDQARRESARPAQLQPASLLPPDPVVVTPEPLSAQTRADVERYLGLLARLNTELSAASERSQPTGVAARVSPVVDELRGTLDGLLAMTAGQRMTMQSEFGVRKRSLEAELESHLGRLAARPAMQPVVTLVADVPTLE